MLMLQRWLTDVLITLEPFGTKGGTRRVLLPRRVSFVERPRARGRGGLGSIIRRTAYLKMTLPPNRPLGQTLLLSAVVIGTAALDAVVVYAVTSWLWLSHRTAATTRLPIQTRSLLIRAIATPIKAPSRLVRPVRWSNSASSKVR